MNKSDSVSSVRSVLIDVLSGLPGYIKSDVERQFNSENLNLLHQELSAGQALGLKFGFDEANYHQLPERLFVFYYILTQQNTAEPFWPELMNFLETGLLSLKKTMSCLSVKAASNLFQNLIKQLPELLSIFEAKLKKLENYHQDVVMAWVSVYAGLKACKLYINRYPLIIKSMISNINETDQLFARAEEQNNQLQKFQQHKSSEKKLISLRKSPELKKKLIFLLIFIFQSNFFHKKNLIKAINELTDQIKKRRHPIQRRPPGLLTSSPTTPLPSQSNFSSVINIKYYEKQIKQSIEKSSNQDIAKLLSTRIRVIDLLIQALNDVKTQASENRQSIINIWVKELKNFNEKYKNILPGLNTESLNNDLIDTTQQNARIFELDKNITTVIQTRLQQLKTSYTSNEAPILTKWLGHLFACVKTFFGSSTLARANKLSVWASPVFSQPRRQGVGVLNAMSSSHI